MKMPFGANHRDCFSVAAKGFLTSVAALLGL
jgi:hypothetical protein